MSDNTTAGRALALRLAASTDAAEAHRLIEGHLSAYGPDSGRIVLATALETMTQFIVRPAIDGETDPGAFRAQYAHAADRITCGPIQEKE